MNINEVTSSSTIAAALEQAVIAAPSNIVNVMGVDICKSGDEWSIVNKGHVIVANILSGAKAVLAWLWKWVKKITAVIAGFFEKLMNLLSGNGFVLTHKGEDGSISVESTEQRIARKDAHHNKAQDNAVLKEDSAS